MKRKLISLLCLLLVMAAVTVPVMAAGSVSISLSADSTSVNSGDTVTVTVSASVDSCGSGGVEVSFDSSVFQLSSGKWLLSSTFMSDFSTGSKDGVFAFESNKSISGGAFQFTLKVKDSAPLGNSTVNVTFTADNKSASKSISITVACAHSYSNSCDTTCNICGASRSISHSWNSGTVTKSATCTSTGSKKYTCTVCGETKTETVSKADHTYDNSCDTDCNVCGNTRTITHSYEWVLEASGHIEKCSVCGVSQNQGEHTLETTVSGDATGHGYKCSVCGLIPDAQAHAFENDCDTQCETCGYTRTITHAYSDRAVYDHLNHWFECLICGEKTEAAAHTPGEEATQTADQTCTACGYVIQKAGNHEHSMAGDWLSNDVGHWYFCACLAFSGPESHVLDEGTVDEANRLITYQCTVCGYVLTEEIIEETTEETLPPPTTLPPEEIEEEIAFYGIPLWLILSVALGISLIVNIIFIICMSVKKRGHFSR